MSKKVVILTSGHPPTDERIYHKIGKTLVKSGFSVTIISTVREADFLENNIHIVGFKGNNLNKKEKIFNLKALLASNAPDIVICCEPLTILAAHRYKKGSAKKIKIISDITEWYPENVALKKTGLRRIASYILLFLFNIYATSLADCLIIGEIAKYRRYRVIAPFKKKVIIGYYPIIEYFHYSPPPFNGKDLVLCYAGVISFERGILNILNAAEKIVSDNPALSITLRIIGKFQYDSEEKEFLERISGKKALKIEMLPWGKYEEISEKVSSADLCFDLRNRSFVYRNSLPIKIFEYMACGKPVIYSNIAPIRNELNVSRFGFLVDPVDPEEISSKVSEYIHEPSLLLRHSLEARQQAELKYNWTALEKKLTDFISDCRS